MQFTLYPALDIRQGQIVRLSQGDYTRQTGYGADIIGKATSLAAGGARWLHLVDLDAARTGGYTLGPILSQISSVTGLQIQTGGGVRTQEDVARLLDQGASRVVIGSMAVQDPNTILKWLRVFGPDRLTIALDTRQHADGTWTLPVHGWTQAATQQLQHLACLYADAGLRHLLCTDIQRDGMLSGPNLTLYEQLHTWVPQLAIQVSGGVRDCSDITAARATGCAGVILGRALLEGRFQLEDALLC